MHVLLLGAGPMACEYAKILQFMQIDFSVVGRGNASSQQFFEKTGVMPATGGYENFFRTKNVQIYTHAIIAVGERWIGEAARSAIKSGIKTVLVEKPGGIDLEDIRQVADLSIECKANVYVGYNRRFYSSVKEARRIIEEDGGVSSFNFEFTEWGHVIDSLSKEEGVKENWFLANSSHVVDLAFYLGGNPTELSSYTSGSLSWHPNASIYGGAGVSETGALFTYQANWQAPGRWGVEILTTKHRLYLRPLEKLHIQKIGSVAIEEIKIDDRLDTEFKPGLYSQTNAFINSPECLPTIEEQVNMLNWYEKIHPYN